MGGATRRVWTEGGLILCIPGPHGGPEYDGPYGSRSAPRPAIFERVRVRGGSEAVRGKRQMELGSTSPLRSASAKYLLSDSRPFPVATKVDMCPPMSNRPVKALGPTLFVRLERVGAGLYGPFFGAFLTANQKIEGNSPPASSNHPRWRKSEARES